MPFDPLPTHLCKSDYLVKPVDDFAAARQFIVNYHYSKGCSKTAVYMHGLYLRSTETLVGVAQWLPPTKPCARTVLKDDWRKVLSLSLSLSVGDSSQRPY